MSIWSTKMLTVFLLSCLNIHNALLFSFCVMWMSQNNRYMYCVTNLWGKNCLLNVITHLQPQNIKPETKCRIIHFMLISWLLVASLLWNLKNLLFWHERVRVFLKKLFSSCVYMWFIYVHVCVQMHEEGREVSSVFSSIALCFISPHRTWSSLYFCLCSQ